MPTYPADMVSLGTSDVTSIGGVLIVDRIPSGARMNRTLQQPPALSEMYEVNVTENAYRICALMEATHEPRAYKLW